jgi:hypothetical protein
MTATEVIQRTKAKFAEWSEVIAMTSPDYRFRKTMALHFEVLATLLERVSEQQRKIRSLENVGGAGI